MFFYLILQETPNIGNRGLFGNRIFINLSAGFFRITSPGTNFTVVEACPLMSAINRLKIGNEKVIVKICEKKKEAVTASLNLNGFGR